MSGLRLLPILGVSLLLSGCFPTVKNEFLVRPPEDIARLRLDCRELQEVATVADLTKQLHLDTERLLEIGRDPDPSTKLIEAEMIMHRVKEVANQLHEVANSRFSTPDLEQKLIWTLDKRRLEKLLPLAAPGLPWHVKEVDIVAAYSWHGQDEDLKRAASMTFSPHMVQVVVSRPASLVEICQLQTTNTLILRLQLHTIIGTQEHQFQLVTQNEVDP